MSFVMNEKKYAEEVLQGEKLNGAYQYTVNILAKYYSALGYNNREIKAAIEQYLTKRVSDLDLCEKYGKKWIKRGLDAAKKYPLCELDEIIVTNPEIDRIKSIHSDRFKDYRIQRLAFTLLCLAKFSEARGIKGGWVNMSYKQIFKTADLRGQSIEEQCLFIHELYKNGYVGLNPRIENLNIKVLGMIDGETEIRVTDINNAGLFFEEYCGEKITKCQKCGKMIRFINGKKLYCEQCAVEVDKEKARARMREIRLTS